MATEVVHGAGTARSRRSRWSEHNAARGCPGRGTPHHHPFKVTTMGLSFRGAAALPSIMLAAALVMASGAALAKMSECQEDCEKNYKTCVNSGKKSERSCRTDYEKCRKACVKKEGKPSG
jgi:hypothetical protein